MRISGIQPALVTLLLCVQSVHMQTTAVQPPPGWTVNSPISTSEITVEHPTFPDTTPEKDVSTGWPLNSPNPTIEITVDHPTFPDTTPEKDASTSWPINTPHPTKEMTVEHPTFPEMTTEEDEMGQKKGFMVGAKVGVEVHAKAYLGHFYQMLYDAIRDVGVFGLPENAGDQNGNAGKSGAWEVKVNEDHSMFSGAERVLPLSLLVLLLGLCTHALL